MSLEHILSEGFSYLGDLLDRQVSRSDTSISQKKRKK